MPKGGKQPGAGRPKGTLNASTISKLEARELARELITAHMRPLIDAQIANARGISYLVKRDPKTGQFERIGESGIGDGKSIEVWQKDPSVQAFTDLMNRCLDKPKEQAQDVNLGVTEELLARLDAWKAPKP